MSGPSYVLVGPPGAGKTTVGRLLAQRLGQPFRDTDADVEALAGKTIPDLFLEDGEEQMRALERQAVATALAEHEGVLALGGGAVLSPENRSLLAGHHVVYLAVGLAEGSKRVGLNQARPLLLVNPRATLARMLEERTPLYESVAALRVQTDGKSPEAVVDEVLG